MRWTDGPLLGFDTETTSADPMEAIPVSYGFALRRDATRISRMGGLINPGVPIPPEASAVNGITDEMVKRSGTPLDEAMEFVKEKLSWAATEQVPVAGMNLVYDFTIVHRMVALSDELLPLILDVFVLDKQVDRFRKGSRKLGAMAEHYGVVLPEGMAAHDAASDAVASILVVEAMAKCHPWLAKTPLHTLMLNQGRWYEKQQRSLERALREEGTPSHP